MDLSTMTKKAALQEFKEKLATDPRWATRGLLRIYSFQTESEQASETTSEDNGVGFTGVDADILSSFAKQVQAGRNLSQKQMDLLLKKMPKYAGQLYAYAKGNMK